MAFLLAGVGAMMGLGQPRPSKQTVMENVVNFLTQSINQSVISLNQSCKTEANANNEIDIRNESETVDKCVRDTIWGPFCAFLAPATGMKDIYLNATTSVAASCTLSSEMYQDVMQQVQAKIDQETTKTESVVTDAITELFKGPEGNSSDTQRNTSEFKSIVENSITLDVVQQMLVAAQAGNKITVINRTGTVKLENIRLTAQAEVVLDALLENKTFQTNAQKLDADVAQSNTLERSWTSLGVSGASGIFFSIVLLVGCCCCCVCLLVMMAASASGGGEGGGDF